jgi:DNA-binding transcriptional LysR family regulator
MALLAIATERKKVAKPVNLRQLEILHAVMTYNTTVAAAKALGMSQPAISNALRRLEVQVGFALFQRENNRIYPTPEARMLLADSQPIFDIHRRMESRIRDIRNNRSGQLRVVATPPLGYSIIVPTLERIQLARPQVRAYFDVRTYDSVIESIETHQCELGFVINYDDHPGIIAEPIFSGRMVCLMHAESELRHKDFITPADIAGLRMIGMESGTRMGIVLRAAFADAGIEYHPKTEVRYAQTACRFVEIGDAVAVVDPLTALGAPKDLVVVRPFSPDIEIRASALWAGNRSLTRLGQAFLQDVKAELGKLRL